MDNQTTKLATDLLSQQIWCWGQDILRPEGNWLIELGFDRLPPPADSEGTSSVYTSELPRGRRVVLRGFGVFFGGDGFGGVFLKRYEFRPRYTPDAKLGRPPWLADDLPALADPTEAQSEHSTALTIELIDWIADYESAIVERLGIEYRHATLDSWANDKRTVIAADRMAGEWRSIRAAVAEEADVYLQRSAPV